MFGSKRGVHSALTLERLEALAGMPLTRVGCPATRIRLGTWAASRRHSALSRRWRSPTAPSSDSGHVR